MNSAPLYYKQAQAPENGEAHWIEAKDNVRLRVGFWPKGGDDTALGTVVIFPGRTGFIESYGRTVTEFQNRGYAVASIDWRGQGLSDRLAPNRSLGHVGLFTDYQHDVTAMMTFLKAKGLPEPYYLCAHSMGGTIALRAMHNALPIKRAFFSAPMWGLTIDPLWRPLVQAMAAGSKSVGLGEEFAPGTGPQNYLQSHDFKGNSLTSSQDSWDFMINLLKGHPGLELGGPSIHWLYEALTETRMLAALKPPNYEVLCMIGTDERVVNSRDVIDYVAGWRNGTVTIATGASHEILMETSEIRRRTHLLMDAFFKG